MPIFIALNCLISPILKGCGESKDDDGREKEVEDSGNTRHQDENGIYPEEELRTAGECFHSCDEGERGSTFFCKSLPEHIVNP